MEAELLRLLRGEGRGAGPWKQYKQAVNTNAAAKASYFGYREYYILTGGWVVRKFWDLAPG